MFIICKRKCKLKSFDQCNQNRVGQVRQITEVVMYSVHCIFYALCIFYAVGIFYALGTQGHSPVKFGFQPSISCLSNGSLVS